jgi:hypothetical protein
MDKVKQSSRNITPFGGLNFIFKSIKQIKIDWFIDQELGARNYRSEYTYSDVVLSLYGSASCGGEYIQNTPNLKQQISG